MRRRPSSGVRAGAACRPAAARHIDARPTSLGVHGRLLCPALSLLGERRADESCGISRQPSLVVLSALEDVGSRGYRLSRMAASADGFVDGWMVQESVFCVLHNARSRVRWGMAPNTRSRYVDVTGWSHWSRIQFKMGLKSAEV